MSPSSRPLSPFVVLATLAVVLFVSFRWLTHAYPDVGRLADLCAWVKQQHERGEELQREVDLLGECAWARRQAAEDLADGRCTLLEAAARFREIDRRLPRFSWEEFNARRRGATEVERHCYEAIDYLECVLEDRPDRGRPVLRRLEAEMETARRNGTLRLPPDPVPSSQ